MSTPKSVAKVRPVVTAGGDVAVSDRDRADRVVKAFGIVKRSRDQQAKVMVRRMRARKRLPRS